MIHDSKSSHDLRVSAKDAASPIPTPNDRASAILCEFEQAENELIGKAVILSDGKAGTVAKVWLDELHGRCGFRLRGKMVSGLSRPSSWRRLNH